MLGAVLALTAPVTGGRADAQTPSPPVGREAALALEFPALDFDPPVPEQYEVEGVRVLFLRDPSLPLVDIFAYFRGGYAVLGRDVYGAATALPSLLRNGGTATLSPDSVDQLMEFYALQTSFGTGGASSFSSLNTLRDNLDVALDLWIDILRNPRFDSLQVEVWRGQEIDRARRRKDNPTQLAFSEFNRLMFGDHPTGWELEPSDLEPEDFSPTTLHRVHREIYCRDHLIMGVTGDVTWSEVGGRLGILLQRWPECPRELPYPPKPTLRRGPGIYLIPRNLEQSTVVMAHAGGVRQSNEPEFFASRIANSILGGSGFSSRLLSTVRTERGYAYSASSFWTAPQRYEGIVGALTQTRSETTVAATRLILEILDEMTRSPPTQEEVDRTVDEIANGFVFNFEAPSKVLARRVLYLAQELPPDWLELFVTGIQDVNPDDVHRVMRERVRPDEMVILILGDPEAFDEPLDTLGDVQIWEVEGR
jgi:predicted Zn-dependent peptidase